MEGCPLGRSPVSSELSRRILRDFSCSASRVTPRSCSESPGLRSVVIPALRLGLGCSQWRSTRGVRGRARPDGPRVRLWFPHEATQADPPERSLAGGRSEPSDKERGSPAPPPGTCWLPTWRCRRLQRAQAPSASAPQFPATPGLLGPAGGSWGKRRSREAERDRSVARGPEFTLISVGGTS